MERYTITLDDDPSVHRFIEKYLCMKSMPFSTIEGLLKVAQKYNPVAAFVDIHLGEESSGLDAIPPLRAIWKHVPIFVITGDEAESTIVNALSCGADDFIRKPISAEELKTRLALRLKDAEEKQAAQVLKTADITVDLRFNTIKGSHQEVSLSPSDMGLLVGLLRVNGALVEREAMKRLVWGRVSVSEAALDRRIHIVRKAIEEVSNQLHFATVYGKGVKVLRKAAIDGE